MSPFPPSPRASRFIEGEPLTHAPSSADSPLFNHFLLEQDDYLHRRRTVHAPKFSHRSSFPAPNTSSASSPVSSRDSSTSNSSAHLASTFPKPPPIPATSSTLRFSASHLSLRLRSKADASTRYSSTSTSSSEESLGRESDDSNEEDARRDSDSGMFGRIGRRVFSGFGKRDKRVSSIGT